MFCVRTACLGRFVVAGTLIVSALPAYADPTRRNSPLGGGFIELLMTGRTPQQIPAAPAQNRVVMPAPVLVQPYAPQPIPIYDPPASAKREANVLPDHQARVVYSAPQREKLSEAHSAAPRRHAEPQSVEPQRNASLIATTAKRFAKQEVAYEGAHAPGTIIIDTPNKFLYLVQAGGRALRYGIGVGRPGFEWAGVKTITRKREWPDWRPPPEMLKRRPDLPRYMTGGLENPLGARALYLGSSLYRIHGTNEPQTIGRAVSSGCIRMKNEDVEDLYERVGIGTKVIVI